MNSPSCDSRANRGVHLGPACARVCRGERCCVNVVSRSRAPGLRDIGGDGFFLGEVARGSFALTHAAEGAVGKPFAANVGNSMHMGIIRVCSAQPTSRAFKRHRAMFVVIE